MSELCFGEKKEWIAQHVLKWLTIFAVPLTFTQTTKVSYNLNPYLFWQLYIFDLKREPCLICFGERKNEKSTWLRRVKYNYLWVEGKHYSAFR